MFRRLCILALAPACLWLGCRTLLVDIEPEGVFRIRDLPERYRSAEGRIAARLRSTIRLSRAHGDFGSEMLLKRALIEVEDRAHHLDHFLGEDSLGMALDGFAQEA